MQKPHYSLEAVFALIDSYMIDGNENNVWFSAESRSIEAVIAAYRGTEKCKDRVSAIDFILMGIKQLTDQWFWASHLQWGVVVDKYGLIYDEKPWFIKFAIEDNLLNEISFHPTEEEVKTVGGFIVPKAVSERED